MGAMHLGAFAKIPDTELKAVCTSGGRALTGDLSEIGGNLQREQTQYDFTNVKQYTNWRELVVDADVDAVDVCLPTDLHAAVALAALAAGKHVLCEKPMALTTSDCDRMIAAAKDANRILMIGQVLRFWPEYLYLHDFVTSGRYGAVVSATFVRSCGIPDWSKWLTNEARSGGAVVDLLVHDIDQALMLFGMPDRVAAKKLGDVDGVMSTFIYPNGPEVRVQGGWMLPGAPLKMTFQVRAERGELELAPDGLFLTDASGQRAPVKAPGQDGYEAEVAYFAECCRDGKKPERCLPEDSARAVKVALLLKQSRAKEGEQLKCSD